jgi:hypothetical protein
MRKPSGTTFLLVCSGVHCVFMSLATVRLIRIFRRHLQLFAAYFWWLKSSTPATVVITPAQPFVWLGIFCRSSRLFGRLTLLFDFLFFCFDLMGMTCFYSLLQMRFHRHLMTSNVVCDSSLHPYETARQLRLGLSVLFMPTARLLRRYLSATFTFVICFSRLIHLRVRSFIERYILFAFERFAVTMFSWSVCILTTGPIGYFLFLKGLFMR